MMGASFNTTPAETQLQFRHQVVCRNTADVATKKLTQDVLFKIVCTTQRSKIMAQHTIGCEYIRMEVADCQPTR